MESVTQNRKPGTPRIIIPEGQRFGRLVSIRFDHVSDVGKTCWLMQCDCGQQIVVLTDSLRRGITKSCGCLKIDLLIKRSCQHGCSQRKNWTVEYRAWSCMLTRCYNEKCKDYPDYGGRGIRVCDQWKKSFEQFFVDIGSKPSPKHSLDRFPNMNGNYEPGNCRWATSVEQMHNTRRNHWIEYNGERLIATDLAKKFGMGSNVLLNRLKLGWTIERALTTPVRPSRASCPLSRA
jgi:hypothetical protein